MKRVQEPFQALARWSLLRPRVCELTLQLLDFRPLYCAILAESFIEDDIRLGTNGLQRARGSKPSALDRSEAVASAHLEKLVCDAEVVSDVNGCDRLVDGVRPADPVKRISSYKL